MTLHQIVYFLASYEEQNFTRAARRCGVKQPSLSQAIKRLESELGGPLFERNGRVTVPSGLARAVQPSIAMLALAVEEIRQQSALFLTAASLPQSGIERPPKEFKQGEITKPRSVPCETSFSP